MYICIYVYIYIYNNNNNNNNDLFILTNRKKINMHTDQ